jgi:hypothetical protein
LKESIFRFGGLCLAAESSTEYRSAAEKEIGRLRENFDWLRDHRIPALEDQLTHVNEDIADLKKDLEREAADSKKAPELEKEIRKKEREARKIEKEKNRVENELESLEAEIAELEASEAERRKLIEQQWEERKVFDTVSEIARNLWRDTTVQAEAHTLAAGSWGGYHFWLGILSTAISAAVGAGIFSESPIYVIAAGILSLILVVISAVSTFLNSEQRSIAHHKAGTSFRVLSNRAQLLVDIDLKLRQKSDEELADQLKELSDERDGLLKSSPRVSNRHHKAATGVWERVELIGLETRTA